jgi:hypothetical protein
MSGMINGGGSPYKKCKLLDTEANESKESICLAEEETELPENSAGLSVTNKTVAAVLPTSKHWRDDADGRDEFTGFRESHCSNNE